MTYESKISNENKISYTKKYVYYSAIVFGLINLVDIFNSNAGTLVKSFVVIEFFTSQGVAESVGVSTLGLLSVFGIPLMLLSAGIRYIADKYGRKPALLLNTIGLTIGAGLILIGNTLPMYIIGSLFGTLFLAADIQLMMIQEEAPIEKRSQFLAFARMVGLVGAMLVPFARGLFLTGENPNWRMIYIIPLIGGVIVTIIILLTLKESSVYLTMKAEKRSNPEQLETQKKEGLGKALKKVRQLPNFDTLILITFIGMLAVMGGLADSNMEIYLAGLFTTDEVNIIYYLRYSISIVWGFIIGKIRDKYGRKPGLLITIIIQMICVILMIFFFRQGWLWIGGLTYGIYIYSVWMNPVTSGLIVNESIPTELRGSYTVFSSILSLLFFMIVGIIISILVLWFSYEQLFLMTCIPGSLIAIPIILKKVPETKGTDLTEL